MPRLVLDHDDRMSAVEKVCDVGCGSRTGLEGGHAVFDALIVDGGDRCRVVRLRPS